MILDDIMKYLNEHGQELLEEGVVAPDYWTARMGLDDEEFIDFCSREGRKIGIHGMLMGSTAQEMLASSVLVGVYIGWIYANREEVMQT